MHTKPKSCEGVSPKAPNSQGAHKECYYTLVIGMKEPHFDLISSTLLTYARHFT